MKPSSRRRQYGSSGAGDVAMAIPTLSPTSGPSDPSVNVQAILNAAVGRLDDILAANIRRLDDVDTLRAEHVREIIKMNTERVDFIRTVDVAQGNRNSDERAVQATTLASQVQVSAETLRAQVAATAAAGDLTLSAALKPIQDAIADLRRVQYEAVGTTLQKGDQRSSSANIGMWIGIVGAVVFGFGGLFLTVVGIALTAYATTR